jgi:hypothetical protein
METFYLSYGTMYNALNTKMPALHIHLWNVHKLNDHRTNYDMEGYHHRLRERFTNRITNLS